MRLRGGPSILMDRRRLLFLAAMARDLAVSASVRRVLGVLLVVGGSADVEDLDSRASMWVKPEIEVETAETTDPLSGGPPQGHGGPPLTEWVQLPCDASKSCRSLVHLTLRRSGPPYDLCWVRH